MIRHTDNLAMTDIQTKKYCNRRTALERSAERTTAKLIIEFCFYLYVVPIHNTKKNIINLAEVVHGQ